MAINLYGLNNRITGLFSGLDTDTLVKNMLATQQSKVDKVFQQKEKAQWKYDKYTSINSQVSSFKDTYFSVLSDKGLSRSSIFNQYKIEVSNDSVVSITGDADAMEGSFEILELQQAKAASVTHSVSGTQIHRFDTLRQLSQKLGTVVGDVLNVNIHDKTFSFSTDEVTLQEFVQAINEGQPNVTMSVSELTNSITISSNDTGSNSQLSFEGLEALGLSMNNVVAGNDAELTVKVNGVTNTISQSSNLFEYDGLNIEIKGDYTEDEPIRVESARDFENTIATIKSFVEDYNSLVETLNKEYYSEVHREYQPLTDEQRKEMTEEEQKLWDEKAKSGILRNDTYLNSLMTGIRSELFKTVEEAGLSAFDIGITTVAWSSGSWKTDSGKISLDEEKLRAALEADPTAVESFFNRNEDFGTNGLIARINEHLTSFNSQMREQGIVNSKRNISSYDRKISDLMDRLYQKEEEYYNQFAKLETMMAELQSQSNWIYSQLNM